MTETNRYACLRFPTRQHARPWTDVSTEKMKAFIGLLILMEVLHLPCIEMYWQIDDDLMRTPGISSIMSRIHFQQIFRFQIALVKYQQASQGMINCIKFGSMLI